MNKAQQLLKILENPQYDTISQDVLNLKSKIHDHEQFIRALQNKQEKPKDPTVIQTKISYHKKLIDHLKDRLKQEQDKFQKLNHSMTAGSPGQGGQGASSTNNLGAIPVGTLKKKKYQN